MAEYIDKKYLDRKFQIDMMCLRGGTILDTQKVIDSLPTADVIERSKIDEAIEEINNAEVEVDFMDEHSSGFNSGLSKALEIIQKNIGE